MRMLSLLITLLIVAWLVMTQMQGNKAPEEAAQYRQATAKAEAAVAQIDRQTATQAAALARIQGQAAEAAQAAEQRTAEMAP